MRGRIRGTILQAMGEACTLGDEEGRPSRVECEILDKRRTTSGMIPIA